MEIRMIGPLTGADARAYFQPPAAASAAAVAAMARMNVKRNDRDNVFVPGAWCLVPGAWCLVPGAWCLVPGTRYLAPGTWRQHPSPSTKHPSPDRSTARVPLTPPGDS